MPNTVILATLTGASQNITTERLLNTYVASGEQCVLVQIYYSNLTNTAANIYTRLEHTDAADSVFSSLRDFCSVTKWAATNTTAGMRILGPVLLLNGEKLKIYGYSSNASDTSITYTAKVIDANTVVQNQDKTGYSISGTITSFDTLLTSTTIKEMLAVMDGQLVISGATNNIFTFYAKSDTLKTTPLVTFTYNRVSGFRVVT